MFFRRKGLILGRGQKLCEDRRREVVRRRPLTGVCRRRRSSARHSCRVSVDQCHGARPVHGPSRWGKTRSAGVPPARPGARASRPQRQMRARCPRSQRSRPERRPRIWERGRPARQARSAGGPPATTNAGKMPALQRGIGLNAVRESGSAGLPPARPGARASRPQRQMRARCPRSKEESA